MDDNVYNHVRGETNANELWEKLQKLYASKAVNNKIYHLMRLMQIRYKDGSSVTDHLNEFPSCVDQLNGMGIKFENEVLGL
ncbi:hypothetical protein Nepgr_023735 [Nepenthes gracilis]|uniref:Uncharacterized protein n=1 Tax=Nepenthes gracilis TaxID=150966 RepID=A0AAD3T333_NEPGR|nr:hypothetical protein Nepgr_023735 [Nepenthes gracilis]